MKQPDIEIYIKNTNADEIREWLSQQFQSISFDTLNDEAIEQGRLIKGSVKIDTDIPVVITPKAAGKAFTSVWFQSEKTPWQDDLNCAESFIAMHSREIRCSASSWTEEEGENEEKWWCLEGEQKRLVRWG